VLAINSATIARAKVIGAVERSSFDAVRVLTQLSTLLRGAKVSNPKAAAQQVQLIYDGALASREKR
jgi:hypothetical protein